MKFAIVIISTLSIRFFKEIILINIIFDISNNLQIFVPYSRSPGAFLSPILKNSNISLQNIQAGKKIRKNSKRYLPR